MAIAPVPDVHLEPAWQAGAPPASSDQWMQELGTLLAQLENAADTEGQPPAPEGPTADTQLVHRRLGIAASLFTALECKHAATAGHSLRVALMCSAWAARNKMDEAQRNRMEIAALLHDIGVIGVPDQVLLKPGALDREEATVMLRARQMGLEILRRSCTSPEVLCIVEYVPAWYDGSRTGMALRGQDIPLGARMIAIAEAFDAMTTDRVYRPAMPQERAIFELFECAGTQFDPVLVRQFASLHEADRAELHQEVASRWLHALEPELANSYWEFSGPAPRAAPGSVDSLFQAKLLDNMYDAVAFINANGRIDLWNHGAERLTGIPAGSVRQQQWHPELLNLADEKGHPICEEDCPVLTAVRSGAQSLRRLTICGRSGRCISVDSHAVPVITEDGKTLGAILLLHDASSEISLEQQCQNLHDKATRDPLTQVANRAEFDRVHAMFVAAHQQQQVPCSLIMCDLDRFKQVNDNYGHQAGDDAIKSLATLMKGACRPGDLVARYGGEEFVMLCADCDNAAATRRAERIRKALAQMPQPKLGGRAITSSFGVTEVQPGDTPETMLRRADRALLMAKANGRNTVVQLGSGSAVEEPKEKRSFLWFLGSSRPSRIIEQVLVTPVPVKMSIEKLRGFVADHQASVLKIDGNQVQLEISEKPTSRLRRLTDRPVAFQFDLRFEEERINKDLDGGEASSGGIVRTKIHVTVSSRKSRDRRRSDVAERAKQVLASFRSYLMAIPEDEDETPGALVKAKRMLTPWKGKA
jgi:diguanylate cyclase (GGDEF)-like protein